MCKILQVKVFQQKMSKILCAFLKKKRLIILHFLWRLLMKQWRCWNMEGLSYFLDQSPIVDTSMLFGKFKFGIIDCSHKNVPENYLWPVGRAGSICSKWHSETQPFMLIVTVTIIRVFSRSVTAYTVHIFRASIYV